MRTPATHSVLLAFSSLVISGCLSEGPLGFVPGGPFDASLEAAEPDWAFAAELDSVDVQIASSPPRTVRTGIVVWRGAPYLPVTYAPLKRWDAVVREAPRVVLRADGRYFEREAVPILEPGPLASLVAAGQAKYGAPFHGSWTAGMTDYFRLDPVAVAH